MADPELIEQLYSHPEYNTNMMPYENLSDNCFDGTWLAAVALNCTVNRLKEMGTSDLYPFSKVLVLAFIVTIGHC